MRKLSRLLAALLTVCLLCGMVLPFAALAAEGIDAKASATEEYTYTVASAEEFNALTLKSGDVVKVTASIEGAIPTADATGLVNFKVVCADGATFALSEEAGYELTKQGNTYYYVAAAMSLSDLNVSNHEWNYYNDFSTTSTAYPYGGDDRTDSNMANRVLGDRTLGYYRINSDGGKSDAKYGGLHVWSGSPWVYSAANTNNISSTAAFNKVKYMIADFDFGTDRENGIHAGFHLGYYLSVTSDEVKDGDTVTTVGNGNLHKGAVQIILIAEENGKLVYKINKGTNTIPVTGGVGVTDHITILSVTRSDDSTVDFYAYVNGTLLGKVNSKSIGGNYQFADADHDNLCFRGFGATIGVDNIKAGDYSVVLDNCATNWYTESAEIDAVVAAGGQGLFDCENVVYNKGYNLPGVNNWYSNDGFKTVSFYPETGWESGDTIITNAPSLSLSGDYTHIFVEYVGEGTFDASALAGAYTAYDYEGKKLFIKKGGALTAASLATTTHGWNEVQQFDGTAGAVFGGTDSTNYMGLSSATADGYWKLTTNASNTGINAYQVLQANVYGNNSSSNYYVTSIYDSDYVSIDFDLGTDVDSGLKAGMQVGFYLMTGDADVGPKCYHKKGFQKAAYVVEKNGQLYLCNGTTYNENAVPLSNEAGKSEHVTIVFALNEAKTNYDLHTYVNGQYIGMVSVDAGYALGTAKSCATHGDEVTDSLVIRGLTFYVPAASNNSELSVMVDNVAYNRYATGYKSTDYVGLDDVVAGKNLLVEAEDVFYNYTYATADSKWYTNDNFKTLAFVPEYKWNSGDTIITDATVLPELTKQYTHFNVKNINGEEVSLAAAAAENYKLIDSDGGVYTYIAKGSDYVSSALNMTQHTYNFANAFGDTGLAGARKGQADSSYIKGLISNSETESVLKACGYLRLYNQYNATPYKSPGEAAFVWTHSNSTGTASDAKYNLYNLYDANYIVLDYDFGTDRYSFSYTANATAVVKSILAVTGVPIAADGNEGNAFDAAAEYQEKYAEAYAKLLENSTLSAKTYYKTVSTVAEYEGYKANASSLLAAAKDIVPTYRDIITETYDNGDGTQTRYTIVRHVQDTLTEVVSVNDDLSLALASGMTFGVYGWRGVNKANEDGSFSLDTTKSGTGRINDILFQLVEYNGTFYFSTDSEYSSNDIPASNELGTTDHITIVMDTTTKANTVLYHVYINGKFFVTSETAYPIQLRVGGTANFKYQGARFSVPDAVKHTDSYSVMIDNIATNWYDETTEGTSDVAALVADKTKAVYDVENVLYTRDYIAPGAKWATPDDFKTLTFIPSLYGEGLTEGGTLITNANLYNFKPTVDKFTFAPVDGAEIRSFMASYIAKDNGDGTYTCEKFNAGTMANLDLANKGMTFNLYLPEIKDASVFAAGKTANLSEYDGEYTSLVGVKYYSWTGSIAEFGSQTVIVSGKYTVEGVDYDVTFPVTLDVVKYATVLADISEKDSVNANLAKEIVDYKKAIYEYVNGKALDASTVASLVEFDTVNKSEGITVDSFTATGASVEGISYVLKNDGTADVYITVEKGDDIAVKFVDENLAAAQPTVGKVGYSEENGYYVISGIRAAFIDDAISVSITYEDEAKTDISATYCLVDYLAAQTDEAVIKIGKALVAYAQACEAFVITK